MAATPIGEAIITLTLEYLNFVLTQRALDDDEIQLNESFNIKNIQFSPEDASFVLTCDIMKELVN